jgi:hypothetical protein
MLSRMSPLLLILVLFSDPSGEESSKIIAEELGRIGGSQVQVEVGPVAVQHLDKLGIKPHDLVVSPNLANHLTSTEKQLVIIRLDSRKVGGDRLIESKVWTGGRSDSHIAIAGNGGDPLASAISGIIQVIGPRLPTQPDIAPSLIDAELTTLAESKEWKALIARLSEIPEMDPRQWYYLIMAQAKQGNVDEAREQFAAMQAKFPGHFLTRAAEVLVPASARPNNIPDKDKPPVDDGSNVLRDTPAVNDEGGNVLR